MADSTAKTTSSAPSPPTLADVTRYRYHYAANLGSIFALEKWLTPCMFSSSSDGESELAAAEGWVKAEGAKKAKERFERHWREYVSDTDLDWLSDVAKCTTVRVPIGYFTLGPEYCARTPFESVAEVYRNAWAAVLALVDRCHQRGIGVLIDLHGLPGGANTGIHSGTDSGKAEFWTSKASRSLATKCLCFIAQHVKVIEGVVGIQVVNEAEYHAPHMYEWYDDVLTEVSKIDPSMPIYISDAWDLHEAISWTKHKNSLRAAHVNPVVVDTHCYWCFSDQDKQKGAQQIIDEVPSALSQLDGKNGSVFDHGAAQVVVGEYSCVLDGQTWEKSGGAPRDQLVQKFGKAQCSRFASKAGGAFFWTYRMDWMNGGEWGLRQMTEEKAIAPPTNLTLSADEVRKKLHIAKTQQSGRKHDAVMQHNHYWDTTYPGDYEHQRFEAGWDLGYRDAMAFFEMRSLRGLPTGGDTIGMLDLWCLKRLRETGQSGKFGWEFEHGLRGGIGDFHGAVGMEK